MNQDTVDHLVEDLSNLLDELGFYVMQIKPSVSLFKKPSNDTSVLELMIRKQAALNIDVECFVGQKAWNLSKDSFTSPEIEMLLVTDLDFYSFLMNMIGEEDETEHSES